MYGPTAATRPRVPVAGWGEGGPLALFSYKDSREQIQASGQSTGGTLKM